MKIIRQVIRHFDTYNTSHLVLSFLSLKEYLTHRWKQSHLQKKKQKKNCTFRNTTRVRCLTWLDLIKVTALSKPVVKNDVQCRSELEVLSSPLLLLALKQVCWFTAPTVGNWKRQLLCVQNGWGLSGCFSLDQADTNFARGQRNWASSRTIRLGLETADRTDAFRLQQSVSRMDCKWRLSDRILPF